MRGKESRERQSNRGKEREVEIETQREAKRQGGRETEIENNTEQR